MLKLFQHKYIRYTILCSLLALSAVIYLYYQLNLSNTQLQITRLTEVYGIISLVLLYISLLPGPLYENFPALSGKAILTRARRATGVGAFYYGLLHSLVSFFGQLGGFSGLGFLGKNYLTAVILGLIGLIILTLMALTSFDYWVRRLGKQWKLLHRIVYVAGWLILFHTFLIGTHFITLSSWAAQTLIVSVGFLLLLEALRIDRLVIRRFKLQQQYSLVFVGLAMIIGTVCYTLLSPTGQTGFNIHSQHLLLAQQAQPGATTKSIIPGLTGDRTKRYTVSFLHPDSLAANQDEQLRFQVNNATSGNPTQLFATIYEKPAHLIVVDSSLTYFAHLHPIVTNDTFSITTQFPHPGRYHLYLDFQPVGAIEQQFAFTLPFGNGSVDHPNHPVDTKLTKQVENYSISLSLDQPLKASQLSLGNQKLRFTINDAKSGKPVTDLKPYLAAFGHLVMINQENYEYLHVHPSNQTPPQAESSGGPTVEFIPLGLYGPIKPGTYRLFAQFNPAGHLIVADFTVKVEK